MNPTEISAYFAKILNPAIPAIIRKIKNNLASSFDSPKRTIPSIAVPTAPIPVQTAYAVPTGSSFNEYARSPILITILTIVKTLGQNFVKPFGRERKGIMIMIV